MHTYRKGVQVAPMFVLRAVADNIGFCCAHEAAEIFEWV